MGRIPFHLAAAYVLSSALFALSVSLPILFAARLAQGVGSALFWVATYALLADSGRDGHRGTLFGRLATAYTSGSLLGTVAGYGAIATLGLLAGMRAWFVLAGLAAVLALTLLRRRVPADAPPTAESGKVDPFGQTAVTEARPDDRADVSVRRRKVEGNPAHRLSDAILRAARAVRQPIALGRFRNAAGRRIRSGIRIVPTLRSVPSRPLLTVLLIAFAFTASYSMLAPVLLIYLKDRFAAGELALGLAFAPAAVVYALAPSRMGGLGDRFGRRPIIAVSVLCSAGASLLYPLVPSLAALGGMWAFEALFVSAAIPAQDAVVSEVSGGEVRGRAYGLYAAATGLGGAAGPPLGGWLYDNAGRAWPFWLNALLLALTAGFVLWKLPERRETARSLAVRPEADIGTA
jgi:MFS family permease